MLDSNLMQASVPIEKLSCIRDIMSSFMSMASKGITKCELLSLLGHLDFAMRVIPQGRAFISRLLALSKSVVSLHDQIRTYVSGPCCLIIGTAFHYFIMIW